MRHSWLVRLATAAILLLGGFTAVLADGRRCEGYQPDEDGVRFSCHEWESSSVDKVRYPFLWSTNPATPYRARIEAVQTAINEARRVYSGISTPPPVTVYLNNHAGRVIEPGEADYCASSTDGAARAAAQIVELPSASSPTCSIVVFANAGTESEDGLNSLKFTLAHEMAHCLVMDNISDAYDWPVVWWQEGAAEYFASNVYPTMDFEHGSSVRYLNNRELVVSTACGPDYLGKGHSGVAFLQHYANTQGSGDPLGAVWRLLGRLPRSASYGAMYRGLARLSGFAEAFHKFGTAFVDQRIKDPGGDYSLRLSNVEYAPHVDINETGRTQITRATVHTTITSFEVKAPAGRDITASLSSATPQHIFVSHNYPDGAWTRVNRGGSFTVQSDCDAGAIFKIVMTTTAASDRFFDVGFSFDSQERSECESDVIVGCDIDFEDDPVAAGASALLSGGTASAPPAGSAPPAECNGVRSVDQCLVGEWRHDQANSERWLQDLIDYLAATEPVYFGGAGRLESLAIDETLVFRADGVGGGQSVKCGSGYIIAEDPERTRYEFNARTSAIVNGTWAVAGDDTLHLCREGGEYGASGVLSIGGEAMPVGTRSLVMYEPWAFQRIRTYQCSGDRLEITIDPEDDFPPITYKFDRVR